MSNQTNLCLQALTIRRMIKHFNPWIKGIQHVQVVENNKFLNGWNTCLRENVMRIYKRQAIKLSQNISFVRRLSKVEVSFLVV